jgi:hypothetical protein
MLDVGRSSEERVCVKSPCRALFRTLIDEGCGNRHSRLGRAPQIYLTGWGCCRIRIKGWHARGAPSVRPRTGSQAATGNTSEENLARFNAHAAHGYTAYNHRRCSGCIAEQFSRTRQTKVAAATPTDSNACVSGITRTIVRSAPFPVSAGSPRRLSSAIMKSLLGRFGDSMIPSVLGTARTRQVTTSLYTQPPTLN